MDINEIYEEILPYLADPKFVNEFLEKQNDKDINELIAEVENAISESESTHQTDFRILLNKLYKYREKIK
jgi:hypothetical protein